MTVRGQEESKEKADYQTFGPPIFQIPKDLLPQRKQV